MLATYVSSPNRDAPLEALKIGDRPEPIDQEGWTTVQVKAASLNHHDIFSLRGIGLDAQRMPMILGTDAAGIDQDGREVIVYPVIAQRDWRGDETLDPDRTMLSEYYQGTFAQYVSVPRHNVIPKPKELTFSEAACLPSAWLTAYRMLFVSSGLRPGNTVLVQGASGGVASALIILGRAAGYRMWVTSRSEDKRHDALALGAERAFQSEKSLPERVDGVMETVGAATWKHSIRAVKSGGVIVVSGATTGDDPPADLRHIFFRQIRILGVTMGTRDELNSLVAMCVVNGIRPRIGYEMGLRDARQGFELMEAGKTNKGKIVFRVE